MREIKFRAWDTTSKDVPFMETTSDFVRLGEWHQCMGHEIMQYTGLKDKNGVEIYEGDIIKTPYSFNRGSFHDPEDADGVWIGEVKISPHHGAHVRKALSWEGAHMQSDLTKEPAPISHRTTWRVKAPQSEVIGNIHENPELLAPIQEKTT